MNLKSISVSGVMNTNVKTVNEDKNIMSACKVMQKNNIGCVIVVTIAGDGTPVGIITERDVVKVLSKENPGLLHFALWKIMSKPLITIENSASLEEAISTMSRKKIRRLVVLDKNNKMVGILTQRDIFKVIEGNPDLLSDLYNESFSPHFKELYERLSKYRFDDLVPEV
jgi:CBS domain-containing protein